jgi:hypothetical protein
MKKCHKTASTSLPEDEHLVVRNMLKTIWAIELNQQYEYVSLSFITERRAVV